jgi:hypothetical protein
MRNFVQRYDFWMKDLLEIYKSFSSMIDVVGIKEDHFLFCSKSGFAGMTLMDNISNDDALF